MKTILFAFYSLLYFSCFFSFLFYRSFSFPFFLNVLLVFLLSHKPCPLLFLPSFSIHGSLHLLQITLSSSFLPSFLICASSIYSPNTCPKQYYPPPPSFICAVTWGCRMHQLLLCRGVRPPPPPMSVLHMTLNNLMVRFQWCWSFGKCGVPLHCHCYQVHTDLEW